MHAALAAKSWLLLYGKGNIDDNNNSLFTIKTSHIYAATIAWIYFTNIDKQGIVLWYVLKFLSQLPLFEYNLTQGSHQTYIVLCSAVTYDGVS